MTITSPMLPGLDQYHSTAQQGPSHQPAASLSGPERDFPHHDEVKHGQEPAARKRVSRQDTRAAFPFIAAHLFGLESALS